MPKFIPIGYCDQTGYDRTAVSIRDDAHGQDAKLLAEGALMDVAGKPVQVRNTEGVRLETSDGPFMS